MKKLFQLFCSIFFMTSICFPVVAFIDPVENSSDLKADKSLGSMTNEDYQTSLLEIDFGDLTKKRPKIGQKQKIFFINDAEGNIIKNAQVIATIIAPGGDQIMQRAWPFIGGYLIPTGTLAPGKYRLEVEVIAKNQLVTDEYIFSQV